MKTLIDDNADARRCSFCRGKSRKNIAAPLQVVLEYIAECISSEYDLAANCLPWESAEGGWQYGPVWNVYDLLTDELEPRARQGHLLLPFRPRLEGVLVGQFDGDRGREGVVVSVDAERTDTTTGLVRLDGVDCDGAWPHYLDDTPIVSGEPLAAAYSVADVVWVDWTGDGLLDVVVAAAHSPWFPSPLIIVDGAGQRRAEYWNSGHIHDVVALPASWYAALASTDSAACPVPAALGGGPALALLVEFNDAPRGAGLVILPPGFTRGAYPANDPAYQCTNAPPTETAMFLRFPPTHLAHQYRPQQNWPGNLEYDATTSELRITTLEDPEGEGLIRYLNHTLDQVRVVPTDRVRHKHPDLETEAMTTSVETILYRRHGVWHSVRRTRAWQP